MGCMLTSDMSAIGLTYVYLDFPHKRGREGSGCYLIVYLQARHRLFSYKGYHLMGISKYPIPLENTMNCLVLSSRSYPHFRFYLGIPSFLRP